MTQQSIEIQFHGEERDTLAEELSSLLAGDFADWPQHAVDRPIVPQGDERADPVTIAALVISVPAAVLATWDLAQRIKVKEKVDRLIGWARRKSTESPRTQMTIHLPSGTVIRLDHAKPEDILDALAVLAEKK